MNQIFTSLKLNNKMKKSISMLALAGLVFMFAPSCKKSETLINKTEEVTLAAGETYTFALPTDTDDPFIISTQSGKASISQLEDSAGLKIYRYVAGATYEGTDQVVLKTVEESHADKTDSMPPPPHKKGKCNKSEVENDYIVTINFNIRHN
jgi:hypothetical protein